MNVRLRATLNSLNIAKFIQIQKNLSKPIPKLWSHGGHPNDEGVHTLRRSHPILLTLDKINPTLQQVDQVHAQLVVSGNFQHPMASGRLLKKLCSSKLTLPHAVKLFSYLEEPDAFLCNTIMRGYVNFDEPEKALAFYYHQMVEKGIVQNNYTFPTLVKACADMGLLSEGEKVHANVIKCGFELDLYVRNTMIHMYAVCGRIGDARKVFDMSPESDLVTWNTMVDGYVKNGKVQFARRVFDSMPARDVFSWNTMIFAYAGVGDMETAKQLFEEMPSRDIVSWNCLIDGYSQIGDVIAARALFDQMDYRNVVSWNSMMALYVRTKDCNECLRLFDRMMQEGDVKPNEATLMSVLTACAHLGRLDRGEWVHSYIKHTERIKPDVLLSTAVLTMYAKCGAVDLAKRVFDEMPEKSVVSWNSMIMGYGVHGKGERAVEIFLEMERHGVMPNDATFVCVLSACTHSGMILEGWWFFWLMQRVYKIEPKVEHYGCMVDLLGRAGLMNDSEELIGKMPLESGPALWGALLSACRTHSNRELGEIIARQMIKLKPDDVGPYVLLSNIYATEGRWDDVENVRKMMAEKGVQKAAGSSLLQKILQSFPSESE
nr:pentatricopeptide repeat-containing protein At3g29230-like [Ipomoea batatas]